MAVVILKEVLDATGGRLLGSYKELNTEIGAVETNTRRLEGNSMFVPYKGENVDGHDFIEEALDKGCIGCLTERELEKYEESKFYVMVDNTLDALWKIIEHMRPTIIAKIICVTGSVGKTTTTRMIASVLRRKHSVFETEENRNDEFVGPEMVFKIKPEHEYAVLEVGMGQHSSVRKMTSILKPDSLVITKIGYAHIGKTGSLEATRDEKCGAECGLPDDGVVFVNGDDDLIMSYPFSHKISTFRNGKNDAMFSYMDADMKYAALAAAQVGLHYGCSVMDIVNGVYDFKPARGRMDIIHKETYTLIDSSYNASLESMKLAIDKLSEYEGPKIAILGEMLEIGDYADELHAEVGRCCTPSNMNLLIAVGEHSFIMADEARKNGVAATACTDTETGYHAIREILREIVWEDNAKPTILVKGSHGSGVWRIAESLRRAGGPLR